MKIIALKGPANAGKTTVLKLVATTLEKHPNARSTRKIDSTDILVIVSIRGIKIGVETEGDPHGRLPQSLGLLIREECDIIICATRTSGMTVEIVKRNAEPADIIWISKRANASETERKKSDSSSISKILSEISATKSYRSTCLPPLIYSDQ